MLLGYPGIDPNATNARMESALYRASGAALQMMVELMSPSEVRLTPVEIARQKGNKAVVALLEKFKKNPEQTRLDIRRRSRSRSSLSCCRPSGLGGSMWSSSQGSSPLHLVVVAARDSAEKIQSYSPWVPRLPANRLDARSLSLSSL